MSLNVQVCKFSIWQVLNILVQTETTCTLRNDLHRATSFDKQTIKGFWGLLKDETLKLHLNCQRT